MIRAKVLDLRNHLSRYLERVEAGEEVIVCRREREIAVIRPVPPAAGRRPPRRRLGWMRGRGRVAGDLVAPAVAPDEWEAARA